MIPYAIINGQVEILNEVQIIAHCLQRGISRQHFKKKAKWIERALAYRAAKDAEAEVDNPYDDSIWEDQNETCRPR